MPLVVILEFVGPCCGPCEEEEEDIGTTSDLVKVQGEDTATPRFLMEDKTRRCFGDSKSWVPSP